MTGVHEDVCRAVAAPTHSLTHRVNFPALLLLGGGLAAAHPAADRYTSQTGIDAIHSAFQLALNNRTDQIEDTATVAIRFVQHGTTSFWLDVASPANGRGLVVSRIVGTRFRIMPQPL